MNLNKLPALGANVIALPMKIEGGSGGPMRVVAVVGQDGSPRCSQAQSGVALESTPNGLLFCISLIASLCLFARA